MVQWINVHQNNSFVNQYGYHCYVKIPEPYTYTYVAQPSLTTDSKMADKAPLNFNSL